MYSQELTGDYQCGIHQERSASHNIPYMWQTEAKCWQCNILLLCMFTYSQMVYDKIILTRIWIAFNTMGFPKHVIKTSQITNRRTENFIYPNIQSNINIILLKQWPETRKCPINTVLQHTIWHDVTASRVQFNSCDI
jgi:hypothetical protein